MTPSPEKIGKKYRFYLHFFLFLKVRFLFAVPPWNRKDTSFALFAKMGEKEGIQKWKAKAAWEIREMWVCVREP